MIERDIPAIERVERYRPIIPDWDGFLEALDRPLPLCLWTNTLRTDRSKLSEHLATEGIEAWPVEWNSAAFKGPPSAIAGQSIPFVAGLYHIQEEVSLLPVVLLDPQPGERILDLCAAPGNKTAQTGVAMANSGTIVANDRSALRMRATRGTLDRLGVMNTTITVEDAERYPVESMAFDRVLLDAPCTCEGTSRKNVSAFVATGRDKSEALHDRQLAMLRTAVAACRPGGRIVYSTCTYAPEENERVIDRALGEFGPDVRLLPARIDGLEFSSGLTEWDGETYDSSLELAMRIWPHQNDTGGFFVAVLEKIQSADSEHRVEISTRSPHEARARWINLIFDRFGIPRNVYADWRFHEPNRKYLFVTPADHEPISEPEPVSDGMPFIRTALRFPKLTTAASRVVGPHASKNVVDATAEQAQAFVSREEFTLSDTQLDLVTETGYILVRHRDMILGVGIYFEDGRRVSSMFPKVLSRAVRRPIPGGS